MNIDAIVLESIPPTGKQWFIRGYNAAIEQFKAQQKQSAELEQLLIDLEEYFDNRADVNDYDQDQAIWIPNKEMRLLSRIQEIQQLYAKESNDKK